MLCLTLFSHMNWVNYCLWFNQKYGRIQSNTKLFKWPDDDTYSMNEQIHIQNGVNERNEHTSTNSRFNRLLYLFFLFYFFYFINKCNNNFVALQIEMIQIRIIHLKCLQLKQNVKNWENVWNKIHWILHCVSIILILLSAVDVESSVILYINFFLFFFSSFFFIFLFLKSGGFPLRSSGFNWNSYNIEILFIKKYLVIFTFGIHSVFSMSI